VVVYNNSNTFFQSLNTTTSWTTGTGYNVAIAYLVMQWVFVPIGLIAVAGALVLKKSQFGSNSGSLYY
jgi:hypothetical protein